MNFHLGTAISQKPLKNVTLKIHAQSCPCVIQIDYAVYKNENGGGKYYLPLCTKTCLLQFLI